MLPGTEQIGKPEVDEFNTLFFDEFGYFSWVIDGYNSMIWFLFRTAVGFAIFSDCPFSTFLGPDPNHFEEIFHNDLPIVASVGSSALLYCSNRGDEQFVFDTKSARFSILGKSRATKIHSVFFG